MLDNKLILVSILVFIIVYANIIYVSAIRSIGIPRQYSMCTSYIESKEVIECDYYHQNNHTRNYSYKIEDSDFIKIVIIIKNVIKIIGVIYISALIYIDKDKVFREF